MDGNTQKATHGAQNAGILKINGLVSTSSVEDVDDSMGFTPAQQRNIIRRIDRRLVTTVGLMYCISLMDRSNLSAASIAGMTKDLYLSVGYRYVCTYLFPVPPVYSA